MKLYSKKEALQKIQFFLGEWLKNIHPNISMRPVLLGEEIDALIDAGKYQFLIEVKGESNSAQITSAIQKLKRVRPKPKRVIVPFIVVPFMGEVGAKLCREAVVSWMDLSGNADISTPDLRILIQGRPNAMRKKGRPSNAFAPKSSRVARYLLINAGHSIRQKEIAERTYMDEGFTSRIVSRLVQEGLVSRADDGTLSIPDPNLLLNAWMEKYDFSIHHIIKGHIPLRSSDELLKNIPPLFFKHQIVYAATGLAAAWLYTKFSGFRTISFYLKSLPDVAVLNEIGFREEARGANIWLIIPADEGVFYGATEVEAVHCVHPIQAYLDLSGHPERANEAAEYLKKQMLTWRENA
jgi:hypothetical protein